jgi:hypothetical protein
MKYKIRSTRIIIEKRFSSRFGYRNIFVSRNA